METQANRTATSWMLRYSSAAIHMATSCAELICFQMTGDKRFWQSVCELHEKDMTIDVFLGHQTCKNGHGKHTSKEYTDAHDDLGLGAGCGERGGGSGVWGVRGFVGCNHFA